MPTPGMKPEDIFPAREKCNECGGFHDRKDMHHIAFHDTWLYEPCMEAVTEAYQEAAAGDQYMQEHQGGYGG